VNRQAQGVVLLVLGGAVLRASLTDLYLRYVRAGLRPFLLVAGVALIVAAIATLWYELRPARPTKNAQPSGEQSGEDQPDEQPDDGHGHGHREPRIAWLLILPLFALIVVAPPALGSYAASRTGTALQRPAGFPALPAGDPLQIEVLDYATRAVYDNGHSLGTRRIKITGFITLGGGGPFLTRMVLSCCAADALPVKVGLSGRVPGTLRSDTWLDVVGTYTGKQIKDVVNGGAIPFIDVIAASPVPAPHDQYEN
jgi:putative membrane protein